MKKKIITFTICCIACTFSAMSQTAGDVLRFSQYYAGGSARSVGMSGAFGALGGDLSSLSTNPAGLGVYRGSEFTFSPALHFTGTDASLDNATFNEKSLRFILNNVGYVYTRNFYNEKGLQSLSFGIAYNRLSDFASDAYVMSPQANSSLLDEFVWNGNTNYGMDMGGPPLSPDELNPFYEGLAYDAYATNLDNLGYYSEYDEYGYGQWMKRSMGTRGGIGEYDLSMGANISNTWFIGASLGIQNVYYKEYYLHEEEPRFQYLDYFNFSDEFELSGWGLNFKAGVIYRPIQILRVGAAIQTPSYLWVKPYHLSAIETMFYTAPSDASGEKYFYYDADSDPSKRFKMTTPWRYNLSAALVVGNFGLVSVDAEYVDYSQCSLRPNADFKDQNDYASSSYKSVFNIKGGAEYRLGPVSFRAGVAYYGNPYESASDVGFSNSKGMMSYSGGLGFRMRSFYMDAAYSYMKYPKHNYFMYYNPADNMDVTSVMQTKSNKVVLTFGFKF